MWEVVGVGLDGFVGRGGEVDRLRGLVAEVAAGVGGVVWVVGEPGICLLYTSPSPRDS